MEFTSDTVPPLGSRRQPGPPCVLVVDDDPINLQLAWELLTQWGIRPVLASNGTEAVALALELRPDLVLMDLRMPVLDGFEATHQIRRLEQDSGSARVPIVAYTANTTVDAKRLRLCGFDGVLPKPADEPALVDCLLRWCGAAGQAISQGAARPGQPLHFGAATEPA